MPGGSAACGCEEYVELLPDGKHCENGKLFQYHIKFRYFTFFFYLFTFFVYFFSTQFVSKLIVSLYMYLSLLVEFNIIDVCFFTWCVPFSSHFYIVFDITPLLSFNFNFL